MIWKKNRKIQTKSSPEVPSTQNKFSTPPATLLDTINNINGLYLLFSLVFLIQLFVFKDYILLKKLYLFLDIGSDSYNLFYPYFVHNAKYLCTDGIPMWSFYSGMGENVFSGGISNPFLLIYYLIGPDRLGYGIVFVELLKIFITGLLFYLFLKKLNFSKYTCIVGGVLVSFLGYLILGGSGWYGHSTNVVYFVLLLYAFELYYQKKNWVVFPIAVFFVATNPFRLYIYSVFLLTYALFRIIIDNRFGFKESIFFLLKLAGFGAIGVGISAVFTFNSLLGMINSPRIAGDVGAAGELFSFPVFQLADRLQGVTAIMRFFSNDLMGTGSHFMGWYNYLEAPIFYCGLLPLLLAPQILLFSNRKKRIAFIVFLLLWFIPVVFPFFRYALYAFVGDYYKQGLSMFIPMIVLLFGLHGLENFQKKTIRNFIVLLITLLLLMAALYYPYFAGTQYVEEDLIHNGLRLIISGFLVVYAGLLFLLKFDRLKVVVKFLLLMVLCMELGCFSAITVNNRKSLTREQFESRVGYNDETVDVVNYLNSSDDSFYRINKVYSSSLAENSSLNDAMIQGYYGTLSYSSFNKQEYIDFLKEMEIIKKGDEIQTRWAIGLYYRPVLQAFASVKYNLVKPEQLAKRNSSRLLSRIYKPIKRIGDVTVMTNKYFMPLGFAYDAYISLEDFKRLSKSKKAIALFKAFVADAEMPGLYNIKSDEMRKIIKGYSYADLDEMVARKKTDAMKMTYFSQNNIKGEIILDKKKLLFFSIPFDDGWQAFDNGKPVQLIKANIGFTGILLEKGSHAIELKYSVKYIRASSSVSIIFLMGYITMMLIRICRLRKNPLPEI